ncbi:MAG TPA: carbon starvation CstA family protein [Vicinamibacterales bacterium]|nr:carbon starvation CstA family protein [Vicinamibacterales bacterium]
MNILVPLAFAAAIFFVALRLYPRYIARVFAENERNTPPCVLFADDRDYVHSRTHVVFAHHFAAIAGAGPIVGPTLALAFGWQPVWLWIVIGGIFFGAVHDMSVLFTSVREGGRTIGEIARRTLGPAGYLLNLFVLIFVLTIVNAIFLNLSVTALTSIYPLTALGLAPDQQMLGTVVEDGVTKARIGGIATTSVFIITAVAPFLGYLIRHDRITTFRAYIVAAIVCVASVVAGFFWPITFSGETWRWVMSGYVFVACAIPVWLMLQPRDLINVQILYGGMGLLFLSAIIAGLSGLTLQAPALEVSAGQELVRGAIWPILFITVACGAISGFHSLVASGTTVKQIPRETVVRGVGYGGMILESFLALLVLTAVASMLPRAEYLSIVYPASAPSNPVLAFALASGRLMNAALPFIPVAIAVVLGILMIEGFVVTTLDTAVRLCRYLIEEFWAFAFQGQAPAVLRHPWVNTAFAVGLMLFFALSSTVRQMWPVFGAGNQLIGALALTTVSVWLVQRGRTYRYALVPAAFMIVTTLAALVILIRNNLATAEGNLVLGVTASVLLVLSVGVVGVGTARFAQALSLPPRPMPATATGK